VRVRRCHAPTPSTSHGQVGVRVSYDAARELMLMKATQPIAKGDEILFFYGDECTEQFRSIYGFVPTQNVTHVTLHHCPQGRRGRGAPRDMTPRPHTSGLSPPRLRRASRARDCVLFLSRAPRLFEQAADRCCRRHSSGCTRIESQAHDEGACGARLASH